ncbi:nitrogenase iron-molybdenum cofactor biosynthesis protein NifN [Marichromatium bheemlicum]|uniref:Nitrogenase iron-molybdenum cofactor biosynthesis protein NifN n=1 Tax=Marichromatium bheemlicum TaxID=365339 RepID=A0ABX1I5X0_9GAMM|nr:nitrogenase iron-molybdenum cofactor biosynthesis protein NifN [Marichromatium bheemlicum]NKN31795.1 nitrogenase iron-molybdenum cofactor biosynthesis protein NifN [Marichromatium bheemlicum]
MAEIRKRNKALAVNPLKASSTLGAALAFLGLDRAIPMLHGSQGCTAFGKVFLVRHFREPIPLQTTAIDQVSAIMGGDEQLVEGLCTLCAKSAPALIGIPTTGLVETQGADVERGIRTFRAAHPEHADTAVVAVATPDYCGSLESGYAAAVRALIDALVPSGEPRRAARRSRRVNVLAGAHLTPGDLEHLKTLIAAFELEALVLPDLSGSLDGHLPTADYSALTTGGTPIGAFAELGGAAATLVIGDALGEAADLLAERTGVPDHRFTHLLGIEAVDQLMLTLSAIAERPVPAAIERQREQLQDAMLDSHFMLGMTRVAIAADPDLLVGWTELLAGVGAETVAAVAPSNAPVLARARCAEVRIGDLEDLERQAGAAHAELLVANAHGVQSAARLGIPLLRAGFPQFDRLGGFRRTWIGYQGTRDTLFELANLLLELERGEIHPYRSRLKQWPEHERTAA